MATNAKSPTLHFIILYVSDINAAFDYYTNTLGLSGSPAREGGDPTFRQFEGGEGVAFGLQQVDPRYPHPAGTVELYFKTDDLDGLHQKLTAQGVAASPIMTFPFASIFGLRSPDGSAITMQS